MFHQFPELSGNLFPIASPIALEGSQLLLRGTQFSAQRTTIVLCRLKGLTVLRFRCCESSSRGFFERGNRFTPLAIDLRKRFSVPDFCFPIKLPRSLQRSPNCVNAQDHDVWQYETENPPFLVLLPIGNRNQPLPNLYS